MKGLQLALGLACLAGLAWVTTAQADDELFHVKPDAKGKLRMSSGYIKAESPRGVKLDTKDVNLLAKQAEKTELFRQTLSFLGNSYSSLGQHEKAAYLYGSVPEPAKDADEKEWQNYGFMRLLQAQQLRQAKQFGEADKVLKLLAATPKAKMSFLAEKEQIQVLEDQGVYGTAATRWFKFMENPAIKKRLNVDNKAKDLF